METILQHEERQERAAKGLQTNPDGTVSVFWVEDAREYYKDKLDEGLLTLDSACALPRPELPPRSPSGSSFLSSSHSYLNRLS